MLASFLELCDSASVADLHALLADLGAEGDELDQLVAPLTAEQWATATPAEGWTVATQIAHLTWTDGVSIVAATDPAEFGRQLNAAMASIETFVDDAAAELAQLAPADLLAGWRQGRIDLVAALAAGPAGQKLPWFGPPMSAASMATARLMETWAHGQDVADALGVTRPPTARLRHISHIGVRTRNFAYVSNGLDLPTDEVRVELGGPDGDVWTWGPDDAADRLTGPAVDFALLVTQRRHPDDLSLQAEGDSAAQWLRIAQAFAGPPGGGRTAGQFPATGSGGADGAPDAGARDAAGNDAGSAS